MRLILIVGTYARIICTVASYMCTDAWSLPIPSYIATYLHKD